MMDLDFSLPYLETGSHDSLEICYLADVTPEVHLLFRQLNLATSLRAWRPSQSLPGKGGFGNEITGFPHK